MKRAAGVSIKEIQEEWKSHFECRIIIRIYQKAISANSIESKKCNSGRKRTIRTKEIIAEVKEVLDSQNDAQPQHNVNRGRSNQWGINRGSWANIMNDIGYTQYRVRARVSLLRIYLYVLVGGCCQGVCIRRISRRNLYLDRLGE